MKEAKNKNEWIVKDNYRKKVLYVEEDLEAEGTKVQIVQVKPGNKVDPHYHKKQTEVFNIQKGEGVIGINGEEYQVDPGETLLCKPNDTHYVKNQSDEPLEILVFKTNYDYDEEDSYWENKS